jgi:cyanate lyase
MEFEGPIRRIISSFLTQAEIEAKRGGGSKSKIRRALEKYWEKLPMFKAELQGQLLEDTGCERIEESISDYNLLEYKGTEVYRYTGPYIYRFYCPDGVYEATFKTYVEVRVKDEYIVAFYDKKPEL